MPKSIAGQIILDLWNGAKENKTIFQSLVIVFVLVMVFVAGVWVDQYFWTQNTRVKINEDIGNIFGTE